MKLFDTHTHMYLPEFEEDLQAYMDRASEAGVYRMALPNIDSSSIEQVQKLMQAYPYRCFGMMGLHPCSVKAGYEEELAVLEKELRKGSYIAVGEIGIDLYWDKTFLEQQIEAFVTQIGWAKELDLPIVIHARDSFDEIFAVLDEVNDEKLKGIFHCFTGSAEQGKRILEYGNFYLGIGGVVTFKNSGLDKEVKQIGLEKLVLETDAPYLTPHPHRGKRNETSYTRIVAEKLAEIFEVEPEEVARITNANAHQIFQLKE